jgi:hypothetical protein
MSPELEQKLKRALAGKAAVEMGQFQFLNLDLIRERAGKDWPNVRAKTYQVSEHFIEKRLDEDDVMIRVRGGFLIIFSLIGGIEAEARVGEIADELNEFFLGKQEYARLKIEGEARRVPTSEFLTIMAENQPEDMPELEEEPEREPDPADETSRPSGWKSTGPSGPRGAKGGQWEKAEHDNPLAAERAPEWPESEFKEKDGVWDDVVFQPVWDARKQTLGHHLCSARRIVDGRVMYGTETLMGQDSEVLIRMLDRSVALAAQRGFQQLHAKGSSCPIIVPVHYDTLATVSQRMDYFSILQSVPKHIRRFFFLRVDAIPDGAPLAQMQELFRSMMHFGSNILAELKFGPKWDVKRFEGCGVGLFGASLPRSVRMAEPSDATVMAMMDMVAASRSLNTESYLTGVGNLDLLNAAVSTGVRLIAGDVIAPARALPAPAQTLDFSTIASRHRSDGDESNIVRI